MDVPKLVKQVISKSVTLEKTQAWYVFVATPLNGSKYNEEGAILK